jgi:NDP-sugar pyrophosphorylase family protein
MVLAAGLGTRLKPITDSRPKALVEIAGRTLLETTLSRLRQSGVTEAIVNAHHFADMVVDYLAANRNFQMNIEVSREEVLLDTGGGLKKAAHFFLRDDGDDGDEPFLLHNVDVISAIDLKRMLDFHRQKKALATIAVQERKSSRYLLFDEAGLLCGRQAKDGQVEIAREVAHPERLAFCGIHVISPAFLNLMSESGVFSILKPYVRLAGMGEKLAAFRADEYYWRDLGKPESLQQAECDVRAGLVAV